ncbi:hypothetical protein OS187_11940 [Xanthomonadaceae bacterium JHOS43]|nr:hypothetical protein [Xanthomonadaceae bacterium JHOS43]
MLGSFASLAGFVLVLLVLTIWMCVKIWRRSPLLSIGTFLFSPLAIVSLIVCWGDEESDIRVPFFLSLAVSLLIGFMAMRTVNKGIDEMAWVLSDEDIAEIRNEDPALATKLEEARARLIAERGAPEFDDEYAYEDEGDETWPEAPRRALTPVAGPASTDTPAPRQFTPAEIEAQQRAELEMAAQGVSWRFGVLDLAPAAASLHLPRDFRFVPRTQVSRVARLRGTPLSDDVLGWVVHRQVDLARDDAWYVQLRYVPTATRLTPPVRLGDKTADAEARARYATLIASQLRTGMPPHQPAWDASLQLAAWQWLGDGTDDAYRDHVVALPLRGGVLEFNVPGLHAVHAELGARSARLVALRTTPKP